MVSQMESCYTNNETYVGCPDAATGLTIGTNDGEVSVASLTATGYVVTGHSKSGNKFLITKSAGGTARSCTTADSGGCKTGGVW